MEPGIGTSYWLSWTWVRFVVEESFDLEQAHSRLSNSYILPLAHWLGNLMRGLAEQVGGCSTKIGIELKVGVRIVDDESERVVVVDQ